MQFHNEKISKLHNLESVFIGEVDEERDEDPWRHSHSVIAQENEAMRQQIINLEYERMQMRQELMAVQDENDTNSSFHQEVDNPELMALTNENLQLESEIEILQAREQELIQKSIGGWRMPWPQVNPQGPYARFQSAN